MDTDLSVKEAFTAAINFIRKALKKYTLFVLHLSPHQNMLQGILLYMVLGFIVLSLPFMDNGEVSFIDNLFTAAAAASTAGLTTVNFAESYTFLGKLVVLIIIQTAGIGYMTMSSFLYLSFSHRLRHRHTEVLNTECAFARFFKSGDYFYILG